MKKKEIASIERTLEIINQNQFLFKKKFGQNFLIDSNIIKKIISSADIDEHTGVIEIGAGIGTLTEQLAIHAKKVITYEIDPTLIPILHENLRDYNHVKIIHQDILKANLKEVIEEEFKDCKDIVIVGNLPYYITTAILMTILEMKLPIKSFCMMMQKEVAMRLCGKPRTKEYNALTIAVSYYTEPKLIMHVPATVFIPKPNVDSSVLKFVIRKKPPVSLIDEAFFFKVVKGSFIQRRKTIYNNLKKSLNLVVDQSDILEALKQVGIDPTTRGEELTIEQFAELANILLTYTKND